jgi:hypothetical protein
MDPLIRRVHQKTEEGRSAAEGLAPSELSWRAFLLRVAVNAWALRRLAARDPAPLEPDPGRVCIDALHGALHEVGVEVRDYASQAYHAGLNLEIVTFEPTPGLECEVIRATVRPAVFLRGQLLLRSQVIVATPERSQRP